VYRQLDTPFSEALRRLSKKPGIKTLFFGLFAQQVAANKRLPVNPSLKNCPQALGRSQPDASVKYAPLGWWWTAHLSNHVDASVGISRLVSGSWKRSPARAYARL
jgi:hypothetical protein